MHLPIFSGVLLYDAEVADLHGPVSAGDSEVVFWRPAGIGHNIRDQQLDLRSLTHVK